MFFHGVKVVTLNKVHTTLDKVHVTLSKVHMTLTALMCDIRWCDN
jgi:hypothetical protein